MNDILIEPKQTTDISAQNTLLRKKLEDLSSRYVNLQNNHETEILRLENSIQCLHRTHNEQLGVLNSTIKSLQNTLEKVRNENTELINSLCSTANTSKMTFSPYTRSQVSVSELYTQNNDTYLKLHTTEIENKRLSEELDNQIEINNILQDQIKSAPDYQSLLKKSQNEVKKLQKKIDQLNKALQIGDLESQNQKDNQAINKQIKELTENCAEKDKKINNLLATISDLKLELSTAKSELSSKEGQICQLKLSIANTESIQNQDNENSNFYSQITDKKNSTLDSFNKTFEILDNCINEQKQQISEIKSQRDSYLNLLKSLETAESKCEELLEKATSDNERLESQNKELQLKLEEISEQSEAKFNDLLAKIRNKYDYEFDSTKTPYQNIVQLIESRTNPLQIQNQYQAQNKKNNNTEEFMDDFTNSNDENENFGLQSPQINQNLQNLMIYSEDDMEKEREKKAIILKQLENAINFIHSLANSSNSTGAPQFDFRERTLILTQCARMGQFIEDEAEDYHERLNSITSLFDPLAIETNANAFFQFIDQDENAINDSPLHELYVMFLATLEVNFLLFNKVKEIESIRHLSAANQQNQKQQKKAKQQSTLRKILDQQNAKIRDARLLIEPYVQTNKKQNKNGNNDTIDGNYSFDDFLLMLQNFVEIHDLLTQENEKNLSIIRHYKSNSSYTNNTYDSSYIDNTNSYSQTDKKIKNKNVNNNVSAISNLDLNTLRANLQKTKEQNLKLKQSLQEAINEKNKIEEESKKKLIEAENSFKKSKKESKNAYESLLDQYQKLKSQCNENEDDVTSLTNKLKELSGNNQRLLKEKEELEAQMEKKYGQIRENDKRIKDKNNTLSKRVTELEKLNNEALNQLKEKTIEMVDKYDDRVGKLDQELKETRDRLIEALSEIKTLKNDKMVAQMTIKKMKIEEKNNKYLIDQLSSQIKRREDQVIAKCKAEVFQNKVQYSKKISELKDMLKAAKQQLVDLLHKKFKVNIPTEEDITSIHESINESDDCLDINDINIEKYSLDKIVYIFGQLINENAVAELASLNLDKNSSVVTLFQDMKNEIDTNKIIIDQMGITSANYEKEIKRLTDQNRKLENVQKDLNSWVFWARSLYRQITEGLAAPGSTADLRCALEESLMTSIGHRKMQRKLEILRAEKKALTMDSIKKVLQRMNENGNSGSSLNLNFNGTKPTNSNLGLHKVYSVRPVVLMLMCARRLQIYSGCLTSAYKCGNDENNSLSLFSESP